MAQRFLQRMMRAIPFCNSLLRKRSRPDVSRLRRLACEPLESRQMLAVLTVTSLLDNTTNDGFTTLREAILTANATPGTPDTIQFAANLSGDANLSIVGDAGVGASALAVTSPITIQGNASGITIRRDAAAGEMRLFRVTVAGNLTLESLTLSDGIARGAAGTAGTPNGGDGRGGAIFNQGTLTIRGSTLVDNRAAGGNGLIAEDGAGGAGLGGGVYNDNGSVTVINATFSSNTSEAGTGTPNGGRFAAGIYSRNGSLTIYNSTITDNTAAVGRGVYVLGDGATATATVHSTIIGQDDAVLASEFAANVSDVPGGAIVVTGLNNLVRSFNGANANFANMAAPLLEPLANNGGPTRTHAFQSESWAGDHGSNLQNLTTDQRGGAFARIGNGTADIGAYEQQSTGSGFLAGDYNGNQTVDAADYVLWRKTLGNSVIVFSGADGNGSGQIDPGDYTVWRANFGSSSPVVGAGESAAASTAAIEELTAPIAITPTDRAEIVFLPHEATIRGGRQTGFASATNVKSDLRTRDFALLALVDSERVRPAASAGSKLNGDLEVGLEQSDDVATDRPAVDEAWAEWTSECDAFP